jgi:hypothetical protein
MSQLFTNVGDFRRGKGSKKTRLGPRVSMDGSSRGDKQSQAPDYIALKKLKKFLETRVSMQRNEINSYVELMRGAEQLRFMNMEVLAETLAYMRTINNVFQPERFSYNAIKKYIDNLLPNTETASTLDLDISKLKMAATIFRYLKYVTVWMESKKDILTQANETFTETDFGIDQWQ